MTDGDAGAETSEEPPAETDLADVLASAAEGLDGVVVDEASGLTTWTVRGGPFALSRGGRAELRLDPLVARAALRTPDTAASSRGPDWIAFAPETMDDEAIDRAEAWFLSAYRRAAKGG